MNRRHFIGALAGLAAARARAGEGNGVRMIPERPTLLVAVAAGGGPDSVARAIAGHLADRHGIHARIVNLPDANGERALADFLTLPADGSTWLIAADSLIVVNPRLYPRESADPLHGLAPVAQVGSNFFFLAVGAEDPIRSMAELVLEARAAERPLNYASGGIGSMHHLLMADLAARLGLRLNHVPYKGGGAAATGLARGDVRVAFAGASALPLVRAGKLRLLAVAAPQRSPRFPDLPSLAEVAPGFDGTLWFGWYGHAGTPAPIRDAMRGLLQEAMASPQTSAALDRQHGGISPSFTSGPAFDALIERERERFARLISLLPEQTR
ncbi:MAG TPA: tripartite tricarboxylate transporter substrate binding protein [Thauera aminoaromatica]|jgi:tripartite-type tricarboxylate transporter receptor subunit TctC|uniref:Tripartite tricarboxylate transporter substrate binding protein n=2 Tax=Thauera aminoaromatica TaxID=164330 RepID=C4ZNW7_THASP|nr:tripartite tricarboxylate transporter substrate binding protein [Thauera aminoaromatica]MDA0236370.1 tripartite tricarboxylate transporter substrate binding protein [Pseudomonadota bacterium]ACK54725.1 conserved hypothetical protein [Thauera aminoaromatica]HMV92570.1 tripartite tricarboxylate transporter substrate binding protein [Thauera aminoaromatica]HMY77880.1 tripartite tricarboxylate transporter substrate binding protein [Thauera aminoaromatica]HMZ28943.1 tripartite tricarboxylate tra